MSDEPEETAYYLRFMSMYIDLGTETVLDVFEYHSPARDPEEFLKKQEETIIKLKNIRILNKPESELLLQVVKTEDKVKESYVLRNALDLKEFDISLLITLTINLFSEQQLRPPAKGWDNPPRSSDKSIAADLLRLRRIRNLIVGHHPRARLPKWRFEKMWKEISEIVVRIRQKVPKKKKINIQERIEAYRLQRLDPTVTNMYEEKIMEWSKDATKMQAQADDLIKKLGGFDAYFEKDCDRYEKYIALLVKGGRFVISALLDNEIKKQGRDLRSILDDSEDTLRGSITDSRQLETLFQSIEESKELDMSTWNISLLEIVTLQIFGNSIGPLARDSVERIGNAYRNYAGTAVIALDENRFADYSTDLTASIRIIRLSGQIDQEQKTQCDQILEECMQTFSKASFKSSMEELKTQGSLLKSFTDIYKETIQQTKDCLQEMITHGISFDKSHELVLKMITLGHNDQKSKLAEKILTEVWGEALDRSNQSTDFPEVKQEVSIILDEIKKRNPENISIKKGCIIMQISCTSASDMLAVINYFGSDKFYKTLRNIVQELGYYFNTAFAVFTVLPIDSLWGIQKCKKGDPTKTKEFGVCLPISVTSPADMLQLRSLINSEEIINSTNAIADALSKHLSGKITIKAEADMKELQKVFDSEMANSEKSHNNDSSSSSSSSGQQNAVFGGNPIRQMDEYVASQECREEISRKDKLEKASKICLLGNMRKDINRKPKSKGKRQIQR